MNDPATDNTPLDPGVAGILEGARMFEEYRAKIAASLPSGLSNEERKRLVFERVYGAPMEDFLSGKVTDADIIHDEDRF